MQISPAPLQIYSFFSMKICHETMKISRSIHIYISEQITGAFFNREFTANLLTYDPANLHKFR